MKMVSILIKQRYLILLTKHIIHIIMCTVVFWVSEDLFTVWEKTHPETFGHVMAFLTTVHSQDLTDEQRRSVVRITVPILEDIGLTEYKREREYAWDKYTLVRNIVHRYVCVGMGPMLCQCYVIGNVVKLVAERTLLWRVISYGIRAIKNAFTLR